MIIDVHTHINTESKAKLRQSIDKLINKMDDAEIDISMVISNFGDKYDTIKDTDRMIEEAERNPRIKPIITFDHDYAEDSANIIEDYLEQDRVWGIKFFLGYQHFYPTSTIIQPLLRDASERNIPVMFHTGTTIDYPGAQLKYSFCPWEIDELAQKKPELAITCAHFNCPNFMDLAVVMGIKYNVYSDLAGLFFGEADAKNNKFIPTLHKRLGEAMDYFNDECTDRFMFGSDHPFCSPKEHIKFLNEFMDSRGYDAKTREKIFSGNAKEFYGIE